MRKRIPAYLALMVDTAGRAAVAKLFLLQLVIALMEGAGLTLLAPILQSLGGRKSLTVPGLGTSLTVTEAFLLVMLVISIRALGQWRVSVLSVDIRLATVDALRLRLIDDLYAAEWGYLASQRRSYIIQRLTTEVERAHDALVMLIRLVIGTLVLLATVAVAILLSPLIGGLTALILLLVAAVARGSVRGSIKLGETMNERTESFGAAVTDSLASVRLMRAHDASAAWSALVAEEARRVREVRSQFVRKSSGVIATLSVVAVLAVLVLILVGRAAGMSFSELAALAVVASRILAAAQTQLGAAQVFANDAPALDRLAEFGDEVRRHREASVPASVDHVIDLNAPLVSLRDISVRYQPDSDPVLQAISLDIPRHGLVTLSGDSGSGKSTLLDVVLGLLRPYEGEVLIDGSPLLDLEAWRSRIGYVPQQTVLVPGTVWQNLTWSLPPGREVTEEDAWRALREACLDDVVAKLFGGLAAPLHEFAQLSGGEQQRLSIARALIRDPELLLLDEATSALDKATEERVLENLLGGTRAIILVTHRPSARARADVSAQLEGGSLVVS